MTFRRRIFVHRLWWLLATCSALAATGAPGREVPPGDWTLLRFVARSTGVTTRPAPTPGHGFESDRFRPETFAYHFEQFHRKLMDRVDPRRPGRGWTALHLDNWESSSQNWSGGLRGEFRERRGYDPQPFSPAYRQAERSGRLRNGRLSVWPGERERPYRFGLGADATWISDTRK